MDFLATIGAFIGGIGGGLFASRIAKLEIEKLKIKFEEMLASVKKLESDIRNLQEEEARWKLKWGAPLQEAINSLSAKLEKVVKKKKS